MLIWTHVTALQGKRTAKIYAGGDHSWAILGTNFLMQMHINRQSMIMSLLRLLNLILISPFLAKNKQ